MKQVMMGVMLMAGVGQAQEKPKEEAATVTGQVHIAQPVGRIGKLPVDPACAALHGGNPVKSEEVVVDSDNNVKWAFVWIKKGLEGKEFPVPAGEVLLDQVGCTYTPHVFGIRAGQTMRVRNSDPLGHNVHGLPFFNKEFNFAQTVQGQENTHQFLKAEEHVKVQCNIHAWMSTWAFVMDHPFFAVTDEAGRFAIKGLPAGKYTVAVWQEKWKMKGEEKEQILEISVKAGETKTVAFELTEKKE